MPKLKTSDALRAAFDPDDHPTKAPQQSVSEQQVHTQFIPVHGLRIWQPLVEFVQLLTLLWFRYANELAVLGQAVHAQEHTEGGGWDTVDKGQN